MNPLWLILLVGGGALYFSKLSETGKQITVSILNISSFKVVNGAIQMAVNIALDNPTNNTISLKKPNIKVFYQNNEVGNTIPSDERIKIKANQRTILPTILIQIPFSNLPSVAMSLFTKSGTDKLAFDIEVSTEVNGIAITERKTLSV